jgi:hypothetical protein
MSGAFDHELIRHGETAKYDVSNPHPLFGKDPNYLNEYGHTKFPMWVDHPTEKRVDTTTSHRGNPPQATTNTIETKFPLRVLVESQEELDELMGKNAEVKPKGSKADWTAK